LSIKIPFFDLISIHLSANSTIMSVPKHSTQKEDGISNDVMQQERMKERNSTPFQQNVKEEQIKHNLIQVQKDFDSASVKENENKGNKFGRSCSPDIPSGHHIDNTHEEWHVNKHGCAVNNEGLFRFFDS
jgi:hypothetical protein